MYQIHKHAKSQETMETNGSIHPAATSVIKPEPRKKQRAIEISNESIR